MKSKYKTLLVIGILPLIFACAQKESVSSNQFSSESSLSSSSSEQVSSSEEVSSVSSSSIDLNNLYLNNESGLNVKFSAKGARISSIMYSGYKIGQDGFIAGRVANRIANGSFSLNGQTYNLNKNDGQNTLHGGSRGFGEVDWKVEELTKDTIKFSLESKDGDMGFPGNMKVYTTYKINEEGELSFEIEGTCDQDTIFNPINHLYMNLNGNTSVSGHSLWIDSDKYLVPNQSKLPTGEIRDVSQVSSLNYSTMKTYEKGNDHCLVLNGEGYRKVAELQGNNTKIKMELYTDRVALQLYDNGQRICLEAQDYIDAIHHEEFPSIVLKANQKWYSKSAYCFSK